MSVFKAFFFILKKNKFSFLLTFFITIFISVSMIRTTQNDVATSYSSEKSVIAIFKNDDDVLANALDDYLQEKFTVKKIKRDEKSQQDALYFKKVHGIIHLPKNLSKKLVDNPKQKVSIKVLPNSKVEMQINQTINQFMQTYLFYSKKFPESSSTEIIELVKDNISQKPSVKFLSSHSSSKAKEIKGRVFNLLAYGLVMLCISSIGLISIAINKEEIKRRSQCSPVSQRKQSLYFYLSTSISTIIFWLIFIFIDLGMTQSFHFKIENQLYIANSFVFLLAIISLSVLLSYFIKNAEILTGITNILSLGTCFISGVFVPQMFLGEGVLKLASCFPTYWFVNNNTIISNLSSYTADALIEFTFNIGVQYLFIVAFTFVSLVIRKERGGLKKFPNK